MIHLTEHERLTAIATLIEPCGPPDVLHGFDLCVCGHGGAYPCPRTLAAWLARGLDPETEAHRALIGTGAYDALAPAGRW